MSGKDTELQHQHRIGAHWYRTAVLIVMVVLERIIGRSKNRGRRIGAHWGQQDQCQGYA